MPKLQTLKKTLKNIASHNYSFTVIFEPLTKVYTTRRKGRKMLRVENPSWPGYQVTVPLLPGLITYGRTLAEAREMARDAVKCHLEGLRKDGDRIPDEKSAIQEKL